MGSNPDELIFFESIDSSSKENGIGQDSGRADAKREVDQDIIELLDELTDKIDGLIKMDRAASKLGITAGKFCGSRIGFVAGFNIGFVSTLLAIYIFFKPTGK